MKRLLNSICLITLLFVSCKKEEPVNKTFRGNLPIVSTNTPATAITGQKIISNIRLELSSVSGSIKFQGFGINEITPRHFNITADVLFENWNTQISMPVTWTKDTTVAINATTSGRYVLNFYNATNLFKSDTVQVN